MDHILSVGWVEALGWAASLITIATYSMSSMIPLRIFAIASSVCFLLYGFFLGSWPLMVMEMILLPINCFRFWQILSLRQRVSRAGQAGAADFSVAKAYGTRQTYSKDAVIFERGDPVDQLYYLAEGRVSVDEFGIEVSAGDIFGEIAFFTDAAQRTATVRCLEDVVVYEVDRKRFLTLQFEDPSFGMSIMRSVTRRLVRREHPLAHDSVPAG